MKIGLIGIGYWGINYVRILNELSLSLEDKLDLYYCDINPERLKIVKTINNKTESNHLYTDYNNLLKENFLDGVIIATPASTHYDIINNIIRMNSNINILSEKPLFNNVKDYSMIQTISKTINYNLDKKLMVGHTYIFNEAIQYIRNYISTEELGNIYYISSQRTGKSPIRKDVNALFDLSYHDLYTILYILNLTPDYIDDLNIGNMKYNGWSTSLTTGLFIKHDIGLLSFILNNNTFININVNQIEQLKTRKLTIIGSKKMLIFDDNSIDEKIKIYNSQKQMNNLTYDYFDHVKYRSEGDIIIPNIKVTEPLKNEISHFINCIKLKYNTLESYTSLKSSLNVMKILNKVLIEEGLIV